MKLDEIIEFIRRVLGGWNKPAANQSQMPTPIPTPTASPTPTPYPEYIIPEVTYYLPTGNLTATGTEPRENWTLAVTRDLEKDFPMGTIVEFPNGQRYRIEDRTAPNLVGRFDVFSPTPQKWGKKSSVKVKKIGKDTSGLKYNYDSGLD